MKKSRSLVAIVFVLIFFSKVSYGQGTPAVNWNFKVEQLSKHEIILSTTANIAPGWHLYSQQLKEGGPQPTRFNFYLSDEYIPVGKANEKGSQTKFYDEIYEMEITWYTETVSFLQKFRLNEPVTTIKGEVEYMTCNNQICVPDRTEFDIEVNLLKKNP